MRSVSEGVSGRAHCSGGACQGEALEGPGVSSSTFSPGCLFSVSKVLRGDPRRFKAVGFGANTRRSLEDSTPAPGA